VTCHGSDNIKMDGYSLKKITKGLVGYGVALYDR
jgi:hypothetical protein